MLQEPVKSAAESTAAVGVAAICSSREKYNHWSSLEMKAAKDSHVQLRPEQWQLEHGGRASHQPWSQGMMELCLAVLSLKRREQWQLEGGTEAPRRLMWKNFLPFVGKMFV